MLYTIHHIVAKTGLFLTGGLIEHAGGSSRLTRLGGMVRTAPAHGRAVPRAGAQPGRHPAVLGLRRQVRARRRGGRRARRTRCMAVALVVSLLTLYSLMKIWISVFWSPATEPLDLAARPARRRRAAGRPAADGGADGGAGGLRPWPSAWPPGPLYDLSVRAAADLARPRRPTSRRCAGEVVGRRPGRGAARHLGAAWGLGSRGQRAQRHRRRGVCSCLRCPTPAGRVAPGRRPARRRSPASPGTTCATVVVSNSSSPARCCARGSRLRPASCGCRSPGAPTRRSPPSPTSSP